MENKAHALVAGLFLLLLGLGLAASVAWFQGDRTERVKYTVVARGGVPGLNLKAPVKLRGVEVGYVESIGFDPADPRQILVGIAVDAAAPVSTATYAQLGLQGVTGLSFVGLEEGDAKGTLQRAAAGARFALRPTLLDRLAESGPGLVAGFAETATRLNALLSEDNRAQLGKTLAELQQAAADTSKLMASLQPSARELPGLLKDADATARRAQAALTRIEALAADGQLLAQDLKARAAALDELQAAAVQVQATSRNLELALVGETSPRTRPVLADVSAASRSIERAADALGEQPQSLIFGRGAQPPGPGEAGFAERIKK
ncbi:phospholipid/cholesterol/gamma-HCH transport system substrate-binding protein [Pelomonas saccharophila]|uniref:Phospholipid/cholesterol/gamma-HCH transport system substrate-binding protein n=1 Tax=Roseateles saccharophilus TaxID=304 RepID=A0ABU1YRT7_ROSSA|nr:MlaD family protein [Roseateles saccharophilus]MDR7271564.1 phospholipid/cholesterol/gamma-HCH transport system substrate-binding protein [Roseateles saccharophilus]